MDKPNPLPRAGAMPSGAGDRITDVPGVSVGHCTLAEASSQTGVTVVVPTRATCSWPRCRPR
jgi:D-aminopeptidase